ncbi:hypothetical protein BU23DRAFT_566487 [Bimuria novae-zelandiae CBS 107.79]|uniref:Borealin N-terminal domain-containing protein n=1 Tax=Bimuria novae-zelandiae CBS 107.79 TaxID=1447943 RepID=A0A6A5VHD9_9PLEO|nr:hypothetical protein BU23DRAFT_566487 [Bimuria novae-zelandiae CBS 107.79]
MSHLTSEARAAIRANLELELKARGEKLVAMCEAQVASLRSRLERRVNRIPNSKRHMSLVELLDPAPNVPTKPTRSSPAKKEAASAPVHAPAPGRTAAQSAVRKTRAAPAKTAPKTAPKATTRGKKRPSDDGDKENEELSVPKKRAKATAKPMGSAPALAPAAAARSTRAASKKGGPSATAQVLSPKPNNSRPAARTRRAR